MFDKATFVVDREQIVLHYLQTFFLFSLSFKVTIHGNWSFWYWNFTGTGQELNECSVGLETSIPEIEKLKAQLPFLREEFSFPRSDRAKQGLTVHIEEKKSPLRNSISFIFIL